MNKLNKPTVIRQVIIPSLNDSIEDVLKLKEIISNYSCVKKIELLPFKKICQSKYDNLNIEFPFKDLETPSKELMEQLNNLINEE